MNRPIRSTILMAALAAALGAATAANAATHVAVAIGVPAPVYVQPQPVYAPRVVQVAPQPVVVAGSGYGYGYGYEEGWHHGRNACAATRWNPNARYLPGARVWRGGQLYMATDVSASVWNVNSPPEWTPNYWVPIGC